MTQAAEKHATLQHTVVTEQEWIAARKELLGREKEFTRQRDELSRLRRELPWSHRASYRTMYSMARAARKLWLTFSAARASSSFITSCLARVGRKAAPVVPCWPTT
jgi:predicted dithiol-disulfide oxidoreductase (DUF899 family)